MSDYNSLKNSALTTPTGNLDLGSDANRYGNIFLQGNLAIGNLVANESSLVSPKISGLTYVGDDTAADPTGGQTITINGSGFAAGAVVYVAGSVVGVTTVVSPSAITFTSPVKNAGNYALIVVNLDGGTATFIPGMQYSGVPSWSTSAGSLANVYEYSSVSSTFAATSDTVVTYAVTSGALPSGVTLAASTGVVSGTTPAIASGSSTYSFTASAIDGENQDTPRNFSITVNADAVTWSSPANNTTFSTAVGEIFVQALSATSAAGKSITYTANSLPSGLSIVGANITGTATAPGNTVSQITATAATTGKTANITLNLNVPSTMSATGGTVTTSGTYKIHTFNSSGTFAVASAGSTGAIEYLIVAGGGSGGTGYYAGGGGAGGMLSGSATVTQMTNYTVIVGGGGGCNGDPRSRGGNGTNSVLSGSGLTTATAIGGGGGGSRNGDAAGLGASSGADGGSGGGVGFSYPGTTVAGSSKGGDALQPSSASGGLGNRGGGVRDPALGYRLDGQGGGGAGGPGGDTQNDDVGGIGAQSSITGTAVYYAGGGGGTYPTAASAGGQGGGGTGNGGAGADNKGGGGGGGYNNNSPGGSGGSGVVIIRYQYQ